MLRHMVIIAFFVSFVFCSPEEHWYVVKEHWCTHMFSMLNRQRAFSLTPLALIFRLNFKRKSCSVANSMMIPYRFEILEVSLLSSSFESCCRKDDWGFRYWGVCLQWSSHGPGSMSTDPQEVGVKTAQHASHTTHNGYLCKEILFIDLNRVSK